MMTNAQPPRGAICFYSATGNTRLACEHVARRLGHDVELIDVTTAQGPSDLSSYSFVGFAAPTDFGGMPQRFESFLAQLDTHDGLPAFVLNTYGFATGLTLRDLSDRATDRGLRVIARHSLRTPENYPPMIVLGMGAANHPKPRSVAALDAFADSIAAALATPGDRAQIPASGVRLGMFSAMMPARPRDTARDDMGVKTVDAGRCTECGVCAKGCPYGAIELAPKPVFDQERCFGCWRCYNRCPEHAISTAKFRGPYYPTPSPHAREVLGRS
jgi:ferredoxin/flavodoxin